MTTVLRPSNLSSCQHRQIKSLPSPAIGKAGKISHLSARNEKCSLIQPPLSESPSTYSSFVPQERKKWWQIKTTQSDKPFNLPPNGFRHQSRTSLPLVGGCQICNYVGCLYDRDFDFEREPPPNPSKKSQSFYVRHREELTRCFTVACSRFEIC